MSEFIEEPIMLKETDSDTYLLLPLTVNDMNELVIDDSNEDAIKLLDELERRMKIHPEITGLAIDKLNIPEIDNIDKLLEQFMVQVNKVNFRSLVTTQLMKCFPDTINEEAAEATIDNGLFTHYGLFSFNNFMNYMRYLLIGSYTSRTNEDILFPYSFMSITHIKKETVNNSIKIKRDPLTSEWEPTDFYMIYNVCKSHKINKKGICSHMMSVFTSSKYAVKPLVLFVDENNKAAMTCYSKNNFQAIVDVFAGKDVTRPTSVYRESEKNIYMCYNREAFKVESNDGIEYELMPTGSYRITLIAHGAINLDPGVVFDPDFKSSDHFKHYQFPFKNIQYYAKLGTGVALMEGVDEKTAIYDVCYDNVISKYQDKPQNKIITTMPLFFTGLKNTDPPGRENFIGLYDCNMKTNIKPNSELFGPDNKTSLSFDELMQIIYVYCNDKDIPLDNVEIKIFACRGFCSVGEFAPMAPREQPSGQDGGNREIKPEMESTKHFDSVSKEEFFNFVRKDMETLSKCYLPSNNGGAILSGEFTKMLAKTPVGATFKFPIGSKTCYEVLPNKHFKEIECPKRTVFSSEFAKMLANATVGETFEIPSDMDSNKTCYEVLPNKHHKVIDCADKTGGKRTRRKKNNRHTKRKTRVKK